MTRVKVGDRIAGCFHSRWYGGPIKPEYLTDRLGANLDGMLAEYAVLNEEALVHVPSHLSFEEAATLPCAAVTAWVAVTRDRRVTAGDAVLTQGSGGVSVFALQFARILGARVIATTSTAERADRLRALGASEVIDYTETPNWDEKVRELTNARGVDCVVEIGGRGKLNPDLGYDPRTVTRCGGPAEGRDKSCRSAHLRRYHRGPDNRTRKESGSSRVPFLKTAPIINWPVCPW